MAWTVFFITDHTSIEASEYARMLEGISWGQEPITGEEHVVSLNNDVIIGDKPVKGTIFAEAMRHGSFAFIPHPAGQGEVRGTAAERAEALLKFAGREFAMEVLNGLFKVFRAWDSCSEAALAIWDELLRQGCRITPLGGSDAHRPIFHRDGLDRRIVRWHDVAVNYSCVAERALFCQ